MLAIIGCGNPNRSDDGVGPHVIARLRSSNLPDGVELYDAGTDGMAVLYRIRGLSQLILIDAKAPESAPGAIYEAPGELLEAPQPNSFNLHDFRWDHALYAGRQIYRGEFPVEVKVFLIEAYSLDLGLELSPAVSKAADEVVRRIEELARAFACRDGAQP
ncbi:MAG: hydrogenase maturation protease [Rhodospirillales bacterium]|nr:hydrogenase maturation protease [Rhodospirillales bacterium]